MLILSRQANESLCIGDDIRIVVFNVDGSGRIKIGVEAPDHVRIVREEILHSPPAEKSAPAADDHGHRQFARAHRPAQPQRPTLTLSKESSPSSNGGSPESMAELPRTFDTTKR